MQYMVHSYISYWEQDTWLNNIDVAIIGSGIVGLSTAYFIKQKYPTQKVVVIERGFLPHGATTRNAGFSCFGSPTEILSDIKKNGKEKAFKLVKDRYDGLLALQQLHSSTTICYENFGGYEIFTTKDHDIYEICLQELEMLNNEMKEVLQSKDDIYYISESSKAKELGLDKVTGMIFNPFEGQIHSGLLVKNLIKLCKESGVEIFTGLDIDQFIDNTESIHLLAKNGTELKTKKLIITTNGFAKSLVPELEVFPARGQVLVTSPIEDLQLKGTFHHHEGFDYFRNIGNRVLLGGGRNLDLGVEQTTKMERNEKIYPYLLALLKDIVIPGKQFTIEYEWSGTMGVGEEKSPIIKYIKDNVLVAVRMGGMGVAIGTNVGKKVAEMV